MARLLSVNVGLPRDIAWRGKTVHTAIWKEPVKGRRMVRRLNIDGDGQGDLGGHGGEQRAVFVYQIESYRYWQGRLGRSDFIYGQFGENFTVEGLADDEVCIGDRYRIGRALFEITQPRVTCYRVGMRMNEPRMPALLTSSGKPGFYFRVLQEGEVEAGNEIVKEADGPERMTVAEINALLYLPGHSRRQLERALRIPALSAGWRTSFQVLLQNESSGSPMTGNPGLAAAVATPAWVGFRPLRIARIDQESRSIISLLLVSVDGHPLVAAEPGQFVVLRLRPNPDAAPLLRSYSLSDAPSADHYRVSIKREENGVASTYLHKHANVGDILDVSAPRGSFTLQAGDRPVVLLSAGVGSTPVLSMLHALAAEKSTRQIWWLFGARNRSDHPFAQESRDLVQLLPHCRSRILYSRPGSPDRLGFDFDASGRLGVPVLDELGVSRDADFYLCGPTAFLDNLSAGLAAWGVATNRVHKEIFGPGKSLTPGISDEPARPVHAPAGPAGDGPQVSFARSGLTVRWDAKYQNLLELAEACDVPVRWSCRTGVCHNCESGLISGSVKYDPEPLEAPAAGNVLICCSRPGEDAVIDI
ncbi:MAG TPA: MOSC and FAD-binding oxidoreductase domain-containing protein [Phototrophicaceae bacterium]|nr:MOSC and FAD-binding oxidoreductase domain-containing protein [Phototrophicaceae bacterium]